MKVSVNRLHFCFFDSKVQFLDVACAAKLSLRNCGKLFENLLFFPRKRNFFFTFSQSWMRVSATFYDDRKSALKFEVSKSENETVWNDAPKKLFNIFPSTFATFFKSDKFKNLNLWLQRKFDSRKEMHLSFLLILLIWAFKV